MRLTWETLKQYDRSPPTVVIERDPETQAKYEQHRKNVTDINEYLYNKLFGDNNIKVLFTINEFPYWVEDQIEHLLCWIRPGTEVTIDTISELLKSTYNDFVIFENLPTNRSVKLIQHFQIFVKSDKEKIESDLNFLNKWTESTLYICSANK